jgi:para-nitrobenzyl esterase
MEGAKPSRRSFLQASALAGAAALTELGSQTASAEPGSNSRAANRSSLIVLDNENVVETKYGKVRGLTHDGIHIFRGIPYGTDTSGGNRFMPAKNPTPWGGVRSALYYGRTCPNSWKPGGDEVMFIGENDVGHMDEECLVVNVWTPGINDNKKRPVMVWMHGGGYAFGSCQELKAYDGERLSRSGDVVVVNFNHRLNAFGFLNLSEFGPQYAESGNVGITDIVCLLQWVRDNIGNFGGDPGNVTIMGQSGGGAKVGTIMAMPSAKGLFHRASIHSGSALRVAEPDQSLEVTHALLKQLDIGRENIDKLQRISWRDLADATGLMQMPRRWSTPSRPVPDARHMSQAMGWGPYVDGKVIPKQVWDPAAPEFSAEVPLLVGTVLNEFVTGQGNPDAFSLTQDGLMRQLKERFGSHAQDVYDAFSKGHPKANPFQLWSIISVCSFRGTAVKQGQLKSAQSKAPAYNFWFQWQSPVLSGRAMSFHCLDLPFFFNNAERSENMTGNGPEAQRLARQMSDCWIRFARTGNPNHPGIPAWKPVTPQGNETMIFDSENHFSVDPDSAERAVYERISD